MEEKLTNMHFKKAALLLSGLAVVLILIMIIPLIFSPKQSEKNTTIQKPALNQSALPTTVPFKSKQEISSSVISLIFPVGWTYDESTVQGGGKQYNIFPLNRTKKYYQVFIEVTPVSITSLENKNKGLSLHAKSTVKTNKLGQATTEFIIEYPIGEVTQLPVYEKYYTFQYKNYIYTIGYEYENSNQDASLERQYEGIISTIKLP